MAPAPEEKRKKKEEEKEKEKEDIEPIDLETAPPTAELTEDDMKLREHWCCLNSNSS